jgi:ribosome-binding factor A
MPHRVERINHLFRQEISDLIQREIKDPRVGSLVSVTEVDVSPDLTFAKVFVSCLGTEEEKKQTLKILNAASGFMRRELLKRTTLRHIPELRFDWDTSIEKGARVMELLEKVKEEGD